MLEPKAQGSDPTGLNGYSSCPTLGADLKKQSEFYKVFGLILNFCVILLNSCKGYCNFMDNKSRYNTLVTPRQNFSWILTSV
jgi:hypothetical protein